MNCPQCGAVVNSFDQYCLQCGCDLQMMNAGQNNYSAQPQQIYNQPQNPYQQPPYNNAPPGYAANQFQAPGNSMALASFVCGIVGLSLTVVFLCCCTPWIMIVPAALGVLAIVLGYMAKKRGVVGSKATAGQIMGIVALAIVLLFGIVWIILLLSYGSILDFYEYYDLYDWYDY